MMLAIYRTIVTGATPALQGLLRRRVRRGKEDPLRLSERRGVAALPRPDGRLIWCHGASVGESVSLLPVVEWLLALSPDTHVLVTTGTVTSARIMAERLPPRAVHQYVPLDHPNWVDHFLQHWRPDMVVWCESEFWPNMLSAVKKRGIPAVLLNARMSEKSYKKWSWVRGFARDMLSVFRLCLAQDPAEAARLQDLGVQDARPCVNLKYAARPLPVDADKKHALETALTARTALLWASTHPGDEDAALRLHRDLKKQIPGLLTVIAPRHPRRGAEIADAIRAEGLAFAQRSFGALPGPQDDIYLADTLGEMGVFFGLIPAVVMGGSLDKVGGHNPIEPAQAGCCVFFGPSRHNFSAITQDFSSLGAVVDFDSEADLLQKAARLLNDKKALQDIAQKAKDTALGKKAAAEESLNLMRPFIDGINGGGA